MTSGFTDSGLAVLSFAALNEFKLPRQMEAFETVFKKTPLSNELNSQLTAYFNRELKEFDIPLDFHGTEFQQNVWTALLDVAYGKTASYKEQTLKLGNPKAIRAVASANGANPIAILVPCHRIIGSNTSLTGYAGELWRKKALLALESNQMVLF